MTRQANVRLRIVRSNVAESAITISGVGVVVSSGVHRRVSVDMRSGVAVNALQTLSKSQVTQQMGMTGRTDEGDQILMMSKDKFVEQVRAQDVAHLEESDLTPMRLRSISCCWKVLCSRAFLCVLQTH